MYNSKDNREGKWNNKNIIQIQKKRGETKQKKRSGTIILLLGN